MNIDTLLLLFAAACFAYNAVAGRNLLAAGLFFWVLTEIL
jgi:hypothetical protein